MRYRAAAVVLALAAAAAIGQVPMYSDYPWGLVQNGTDQGPVYNLDCQPPLVCSSPSYGNGRIQLGDGGVLPIIVAYAADAGFANSAAVADLALYARDSGFADLSAQSFFAFDAGFAYTAGSANTAAYAFDAGAANYATAAGVAIYALDAGQADYAPVAGYAAAAGTANTANTADLAAYAYDAGRANYADTAGVATYALDAGRANYADTAGVAAYALDAGRANYADTAGSAGTSTTAQYAFDAGNVVCVGCIVADRIGLAAVIREKIQAGAVNHTVIEDGGILGNNIIPGGVTSTQIATGGVATANIANGAVTESQIGALAVTEGKLGALAVTEGKLGAGAVTNTKLGDLSVSSGKLQDSAVTTAKLNALAVDSTKLAAGAVTTAKIAANAVTTNELGAAAVTSTILADGSVLEAKVATSAITTTKLADMGVTAPKLDDGIPLTAYDEAGVAGISSRSTATNATKGSWDGSTGYIRFTVGSGVTNPQVSTGLYTGTSTNLLTPKAVMRYRLAGDFAAKAPTAMTAKNTANVAQTASAVFVSDGNWHTAVFDISGWTTVGTLRIDLTTATDATAYWDIAYVGTGIPGGGTGALISKAGNVGVGITPTSKLHVDGTITIGTSTNTYQAGVLGYTDANWGFIYRPPQAGAIAAHNFEAYDGSDLLTITNGGYVGIGTLTPGSFRLAVVGPAAGTATGPVVFSTPGTAQGERSALAMLGTFQATPGDNTPRRAADVVAGFNGGNWGTEYMSLNVGNNGSGNDAFALTAEKVRITSGGDVGISVTAPRSRMHVYGTSATPVGSGSTEKANLIVEGSATNALKMGTDPASPYGSWIQSTDRTNNGIQYPLALNPMGGKVGVNTLAPEEQLEVKTGTTAYGVLHSDGTRKVGSYVDTSGGWYGTKSNHDLHLFTNNGAKRLTVTTAGNVDIASFGTPASETHVCSDTTGVLVLCSASDERKKEKIRSLGNPLKLVLQMRPVRYEWKDKGRMGKGEDIGFVAQEIMTVLPEVVGNNSDGTYLIHYDKLTAVLAGAIQELYEDRTWLAKRVQALEDRAQAAEDKLAQLEARLAKLEGAK